MLDFLKLRYRKWGQHAAKGTIISNVAPFQHDDESFKQGTFQSTYTLNSVLSPKHCYFSEILNSKMTHLKIFVIFSISGLQSITLFKKNTGQDTGELSFFPTCK